MGNHPSKPAGEAPGSPVVHTHSSSSSTANSRKESKVATIRKVQRADSPSTSEKVSLHTTRSSSPQQRAPDPTLGGEFSKEKVKDNAQEHKEKHKAKTTPVKVPRGADPQRQRGPDSQFEPSGPPKNLDYIPQTNLNFPPRLPLPIEEEIHTPGSPILDPQGFASALREEDVEGGALPRQASTVSNTTVGDDELGDELHPYQYEPSKGTVPTLVQWKQGGDRVYVTGTFTNWNKKFRMHKDSNTGYLSAILQLIPGTHHVKFIIDGDMQLSNELPTAVDYTNILVNYIEVSADDIPKAKEEAKVPDGVYPPQVLPHGTEAKDHAPDSIGKTRIGGTEVKPEPVFWGKEMPPYLLDIDKPEGSIRQQRAARGQADFPPPPGLPLFLGKSILNGTTPMKDDSSVLNMPNHTVLNHLATSSIKNQVIATSLTTRYKRKYVTTIVYKPTEADT